jgi:hypothetical protein
MKRDLEKPIENAVFKLLSFERKVLSFKVETKGVYNPVTGTFRKAGKYVRLGCPDIHLTVNVLGLPIAVYWEIKATFGVQSDNQKRFQEDVEKVGGFYFIIRSLADAEHALAYVQAEVIRRIQGSNSHLLS